MYNMSENLNLCGCKTYNHITVYFKNLYVFDWYDGPLDELCVNFKTNELFFKIIIDEDENLDPRWLIFFVKKENLLLYLNGKIGRIDLLNLNNFCIIQDSQLMEYILKVEDIPKKYLLFKNNITNNNDDDIVFSHNKYSINQLKEIIQEYK